jgi:hypothetical protein
MFRRKYNISLLDSKWQIIKGKIKFKHIPRKDEYLYYEEKYYIVLNVIHSIEKKNNIFLVIDPIENISKKI